ncbi:TlpA family protein disulfide reductase [Aliikangiella coralliicola]|uniref:TlpA family protein disulfide reductase n=1 Tax=Aliikangiella coralliicola TaxID=2592383 RepID=A0A545UAT5_9GAMM|nr:TlpA disulfide reductase family protein [Aliikangiella coralliicola]TQV86579.1 TlpA family protein disulfide reductase [Aliikangiella coralliicola]
MKKRTVFGFKAFLTGLMLVACSTLSAADKVAAPDFTLKSLTGENLRLSDFRGQVVLLNFWASWCGPCRQEMPILDEIHKKYEPLGFAVLGVNVDLKSEKAIDYLRGTPVKFPILLDPKSKVSEQYSVSAMPSTAIIDRDGNVRYVHAGYKTGDEEKYKNKIKELMRE